MRRSDVRPRASSAAATAESSRWQRFVSELWIFGLVQAWACLFAGLLLVLIAATALGGVPAGLHRYDFLFLAALGLQIALLASGLETWREARVIAVFHLVATAMELFKTSPAIGSWSYPGVEGAVFAIAGVPLFAGFMYSAVGSYIARVWRLMDFRFTDFPRLGVLAALALLAYLNFFTHHWWVDLRGPLVLAIVLVLGRCRVRYRPGRRRHQMPLSVGLGLVALFIWFAENLATAASVWRYPDQAQAWSVVSPHKIVAWFLLMFLSFVLVARLHREELDEMGALRSSGRPQGWRDGWRDGWRVSWRRAAFFRPARPPAHRRAAAAPGRATS